MLLTTLRRTLRRLLRLPPVCAIRNKRPARRGDYTVIERDGIAYIVPRAR